jgi:Zn ribbon nucleic-acid-binding protein
MSDFKITLDETILTEESERLEDVLAILMECLGYQGRVKSNITGNLTVFPCPSIKGDEDWLDLMSRNLRERAYIKRCPMCGGVELFTPEDDSEMTECNECGYLWETDDGKADG